jgi:imidazolonepropionase-like amidohydrolase
VKAAPEGHYLLTAARLFSAVDGATADDAAVEIDDGRIIAVHPSAAWRNQESMRALPVVPYSDCTILPGLIDAHCHLTLTGDGKTYEEQVLDPDEMMSLIAVSNLQRHLGSGVTTLRDNGGRNRVVFVVREAINRGYIHGPRLLLAGRPLTHSLGHFYWCNGVADGDIAIRAAVRALVAEGADHIKIMASGGATLGNIPYYPSYTADEMRAAVDTAHGLGRLTTAHCRATQSIANAVEAGLDCIEHAEFLQPGEIFEFGSGVASSGRMAYEPKLGARLLEAGLFVSFTAQTGGHETLLGLREARRAGAELTAAQTARVGALEAYFDMKLGLLASLLAEGFLPRLVISSDAGPYDVSFGGLQHGISLAVDAGMSASQALMAATATAAQACGIAAEVGTIRAGLQADLLVVRGDPTRDIGDLWNVEAVYQHGRIVAPLMARSAVDEAPAGPRAGSSLISVGDC